MIKRIELVNFMSHEHSVIDLAEGLTVLVGPNNCGKSAVVTALQILCYNDASTYVMRHGASQCSIALETDDGHVVHWSRKKNGSPRYEIDGQVFDRLGKGGGNVPPELHEILQMPRVSSDRDEFDVHFGTQREPVFLLNDPPAAAADFFASSSDAIRLVEMQSLHKQRVKETSDQRKRLTRELDEISATLETLRPLKRALTDLDKTEQQYRTLQADQATIESLKISIRALREQQQTLRILDRRASELAPLGPPPKLPDTRTRQQIIDDMVRESRVLRRAGQMAESLAALAAPVRPTATGELEQSIDALQQTSTALAASRQSALAMESLQSAPKLVDTDPLEKTLRDLIRMSGTRARLQSELKTLSPISSPPTPADDPRPLQDLVQRLADATSQQRRLAKKLTGVQTEMEQVVSLFDQWSQAHPRCPTCGQGVTTRQLLGPGGHTHGD